MMRFVTSDGLSVAYADTGDGPPVLCLPGLTRNMADFDDLAAVIGTDFRLIRMDYRGRGASDHDPVWQNYAIPIEARDVLELLDHLKLEKVSIVGTSRGGLIAMALATFAHDRLASVILNDVGPAVAREGLETILTYIGRPPSFTTYDAAARRLAEINAASFPDVGVNRWEQFARRTWIEKDGGLAINYDPKLRDATVAAMEAPEIDLWPFFDALAGIPLGLIRGAYSDILSHETAMQMQARRPDMVFATIENRGHVPFLDEPEAVSVIRATINAAR